MITESETEIRSHSHLMDAEGTSPDPIETKEVSHFLSERGWDATNIETWHDPMQGVYRWSCDIAPLESGPYVRSPLLIK